MQEDYLNVTNRIQFDDSVEKYTYHSYVPHNILTINNSDEIRICINNQDLLTRPGRSFIYIKGEIENHAKGHLVNNALAFLFDEIRYEVANKEVDMVRKPGIAGLMKLLPSANSLVKYSNAAIDTDENLKAIPKDGKFSGCIPMEMLLGLCEDFNRVLVNQKQELILKRAKDDSNSLLTTSAATDTTLPTIKLTTIQWIVPHVLPADREKLNLREVQRQDIPLQMAFRSFELHELPAFPKTTKHTWAVKTTTQLEKPRFIIFGFQTARDGKPRNRSDRFDHCKLKNFKVFLNSDSYPYDDLNLDFANNEVSKAYEMFIRFRESYYYELPDPVISRSDYISSYPLIVVDCSKQNEAIKEGVVDLKLEIECAENVPENTTAYCLIIHDKEYNYKPVSNEINKT